VKALNHPDYGSILDMPLRELLGRFGSSHPSPGGGAGSSLTGSLGAALVEMTANLTIGRPRFAAIEEKAREIARDAADLRERLAALADADAEAFERVGAAYRMPRGDDAQKAARSQAIQSALLVASEVPLETARLSARVIELAEQAAPILNPTVISDVLVGALLAQAAQASATINIEINVASMTDRAATERLTRGLAEAQAGVDERMQKILTAGRSRFPGQHG
jgi:formiminotetrahydrofolate cyclodeaminase